LLLGSERPGVHKNDLNTYIVNFVREKRRERKGETGRQGGSERGRESVAKIQMSKRPAFPQHHHKPPRTIIPDRVVANIQMHKQPALPQHPRKPPRTLSPDRFLYPSLPPSLPSFLSLSLSLWG
jgi:hypothetical protein